MNPPIAQSEEFGSPAPQPNSGYTLTETIVATAIFSIAMLAVLACQISGIRLNQFVQPKVENSRYARQTLGTLMEEVRSANSLQVGTGTVSSFVPAASSKPQAGNALRIFATTNLSQYIYYYEDTNTSSLMKIPLGASTAIKVATAVTNGVLFSMEDFTGTFLTNSQNNAVMSILMQMRRDTTVSGISDSYQVRAKITRRNIL